VLGKKETLRSSLPADQNTGLPLNAQSRNGTLSNNQCTEKFARWLGKERPTKLFESLDFVYIHRSKCYCQKQGVA
jgi:hypothetical protein